MVEFEGIKIDYDFYDKVEDESYVPNILYGDTDSIFIKLLDYEKFKKMGYEFKDKESVEKIEKELVLPASTKINSALVEFYNNYILKKLNVKKEYNRVDFKTEMIMSDILFLGVKKRYIYKLWKKEEAFFIPPKIKYTGIELKRSDTARITKDILNELIELIMNENDIEIRKNRALEIVKKYKEIFSKTIKELNLEYIGIPSNWSLRQYKQDPSYILGARLYNTLIHDICRPGTKGYRIAIQIDPALIIKYIKENNIKGEYQLSIKDVKADKITFLFVPPNFDKVKLKQVIDKGYFKIKHISQYKAVIDDKIKIYLDIAVGKYD